LFCVCSICGWAATRVKLSTGQRQLLMPPAQYVITLLYHSNFCLTGYKSRSKLTFKYEQTLLGQSVCVEIALMFKIIHRIKCAVCIDMIEIHTTYENIFLPPVCLLLIKQHSSEILSLCFCQTDSLSLTDYKLASYGTGGRLLLTAKFT